MAEQFGPAKPASLTVAPIPFDFGTGGPNPYSSDHQQFEYIRYDLQTFYDTDEGVRVIPTGADDPATLNEVIRFAREVTRKYVIFDIIRLGAKPKVPSADTSNPNEICERRIISPIVPLQYPNMMGFRVSGMYIYGLRQPLTETDGVLPMGVTGADTNASSDQSQNIVPADFDKRILNAKHAIPTGFVVGGATGGATGPPPGGA